MYHYLLQEEQDETQELELSVKCFELNNLANSVPLDSFFVVKLIEKNKPIKQLVKSKVYWGCSNPEYEEKFKLEFCFKNEQNLLLEVFSHETKPRLYGWIQTTVSKIFGSKNKMFEDYLKTESKQKKFSTSRMQIVCKKKQKSIQQLTTWKLKIEAFEVQPLRKMYFFAEKSPFYFIVSKIIKNTRTLIYKSESSTNFVHQKFKQFEVRKKVFQENFCQFQISVYQGQNENKKQLGGLIFFPIDLELKKPQMFCLKNSANETVGSLKIFLLQEFRKYTFTDYLDAGLEFKVICNIDFTASNKKPCEPDSLHRVGSGLSAYQEAMTQTLKILLDYDEDKLIPTYGFGAKVFMPNFNSEGKVSHCFPLNGDQGNPNLKQLDGVLKAYRKSLNNLQFAGPTNFKEIIKNAISQCETFSSNLSQYTIVFILTDGQLHDINPVVDLIDKNSHLPLSIIIVGLGDSNFEQMHKLDGDNEPLFNNKGKKVRDIVQFVNFREARSQSFTLAVKILQQLPNQVLNFFSQNNIIPKRIHQYKTQRERERDSLTGSKIFKKSVEFKQILEKGDESKNFKSKPKFKSQSKEASLKNIRDIINSNKGPGQSQPLQKSRGERTLLSRPNPLEPKLIPL